MPYHSRPPFGGDPASPVARAIIDNDDLVLDTRRRETRADAANSFTNSVLFIESRNHNGERHRVFSARDRERLQRERNDINQSPSIKRLNSRWP